jgi:hypothetical protein
MRWSGLALQAVIRGEVRVSNGVMAGRPGHPLWDLIIKKMKERAGWLAGGSVDVVWVWFWGLYVCVRHLGGRAGCGVQVGGEVLHDFQAGIRLGAVVMSRKIAAPQRVGFG